jgi:hypothetical protein
VVADMPGKYSHGAVLATYSNLGVLKLPDNVHFDSTAAVQPLSPVLFVPSAESEDTETVDHRPSSRPPEPTRHIRPTSAVSQASRQTRQDEQEPARDAKESDDGTRRPSSKKGQVAIPHGLQEHAQEGVGDHVYRPGELHPLRRSLLDFHMLSFAD